MLGGLALKISNLITTNLWILIIIIIINSIIYYENLIVYAMKVGWSSESEFVVANIKYKKCYDYHDCYISTRLLGL